MPKLISIQKGSVYAGFSLFAGVQITKTAFASYINFLLKNARCVRQLI